MVGGGHPLFPGEISLAHNGVLFLDELPEFQKNTLESLRQPLEEKLIHLSRSRQRVSFPANFMLVASMNPCPCGYYNHPTKTCDCPPGNIARYLGKISGPLLDRIDLHIPIAPTTFDEISSPGIENYIGKDAAIKQQIVRARGRQLARFKRTNLEGIYSNSQLSGKSLLALCPLDTTSSQLIKSAMEKLNLSARAYHKILKVSRTIADLEDANNIEKHHIAEAIQYRNLDRNWGLG
jgi:magnesium chelatase family protein